MTETRRFTPQRLRGLFEPQSIALVGASDKSSWSMMVHNNLTLGEYTGRIYYINPRNPAVHGRPAVPRLADIGAPVDLAYIMVPGEAVLPVVREMAEAGIHNAIVLTAGASRTDEGGDAPPRLPLIHRPLPTISPHRTPSPAPFFRKPTTRH